MSTRRSSDLRWRSSCEPDKAGWRDRRLDPRQPGAPERITAPGRLRVPSPAVALPGRCPRPPESIATARLDLVPLRVADAGEMVAVLADPGLYRFIGGRAPTRAELAARFAAQVRGRSPDGREEWRNWIVRERQSRAATGFVQATISGSDDAGRSAEVAWLIGVPWQGRGFAGEAAEGLVRWLETARIGEIVAHVHPEHAASAAIAARAGFEPTDIIVDGERRWRRVVGPVVRPRSRPPRG